MKKGTWNIRHLVDESFVPPSNPAYYIEDCPIFEHSSGFFGGLVTFIVSDLEHLDIRMIFQQPGIKLESFEEKPF